jgi:hypothetical protein
VSRIWSPRSESPVARARRTAALSSLRMGRAGLARRQRTERERRAPTALVSADASWTTAHVLAVNIAVVCLLAAVIVLVSSLIEHVTRQAFVVIFALLTLFLIRRGSRLRRRGLERLGRSITGWAGITGSLVVVSGALALQLTSFVPELLALSAGWQLLLGVWKDLPVLVTAAVVLVVPIVWGAFVWDRSLVGAVLIVVAAGTYARAGSLHRTLFGALVVSGVVVVIATVHQLTHARGADAFDGSDLLAVTIVVACLAASAEVESWHEDWGTYGAIIRSVTVVSAIALAALVAQAGWVGSWVSATPPSALARVVVAGFVTMIILWIAVSNRPVRPGGRLKIATWSLATVVLLGTLIHAFSLGAVRWVAVAALAFWGLRAVRNGLRRSRPWSVAGGLAVVLGATVPVVIALPGLLPLVLLLFAVGITTAIVVVFSRPEAAPIEAAPVLEP